MYCIVKKTFNAFPLSLVKRKKRVNKLEVKKKKVLTNQNKNINQRE